MAGLARAFAGVLAMIAFAEAYARGHGPLLGTGAALVVFLVVQGSLAWLSRSLPAPPPARASMRQPSSAGRARPARRASRRRILSDPANPDDGSRGL